MAPPRLTGLTKLTLETAPSVCHSASGGSPAGRAAVDKDRWMERVEDEFGAFGTCTTATTGGRSASIQYGPAPLFPHA